MISTLNITYSFKKLEENHFLIIKSLDGLAGLYSFFFPKNILKIVSFETKETEVCVKMEGENIEEFVKYLNLFCKEYSQKRKPSFLTKLGQTIQKTWRELWK